MSFAKAQDLLRLTQMAASRHGGVNLEDICTEFGVLSERLWLAVHNSKWMIDGLGELVGWALPDRFPPRNGRTSKSLKSLGHDVTVHVG